jgi:anti-sigma regulatory factor (Ser/Thr protein kinase)
MFVRHTLERWNLPQQIDTAELVTSELVTNAVKATGVTVPEPTWTELDQLNLISLRILARGDAFSIQVWDASAELPVRPAVHLDHDAESGRGLLIVHAVARQVGHFYPGTGGKVVWAELMSEPPASPLPRREVRRQANIRLAAPDPELLRTVLEQLRTS